MATTRVYEWFIEPLNDFTNEVIARVMADVGESDFSNLSLALHDNEGKVHNVWSVDYSLVNQLQKSQQPLKFAVFNRCSSHAPIRRWQFGMRRQKRSKIRKGIKS